MKHFTYIAELKAKLTGVNVETANTIRELENLHPGIEGKKADRESELIDELENLEAEREDILAELEPDEDDDDDEAA